MKHFFFLFLSLTFLGCPDDDGVKPPVNPLQIRVDDVTCTEVFLNISLAASEANRSVTLKRGDSTIFFALQIPASDTVVVDDGLLPNKTYTYTLKFGEWSAAIQATTLDTTSHNIQWQLPDTLGAQGLIRDVWVFSQNDAWAVGEFYLADSTGKPDMENPYNAAHWDGNMWEAKQILVRDFGTGTGYYPLYAIFAFGPNDIWFASAADFIHWNGMQFTSEAFFMTQIPFDGQVSKIWGTSGNSLYCVGRTGSIYHYTGSGTWTKMTSNTTVDLQDIWGIDNTHVWATGTNVSDGHSVVLQFDGKRWTTIYDNVNAPPSTLFHFNTLWTDNADRIFLAGGSRTQLMNLSNKYFQPLNVQQQQWTAFKIRGMNRRDIFQIGSAGEALHFNGNRWYLYPELRALNDEFVGFNSVHPTKDFVLIGGLFLTQLNGFPIVVRGYR